MNRNYRMGLMQLWGKIVLLLLLSGFGFCSMAQTKPVTLS